ncbi:MAG: gluconokinase [Verrucomicrobia bacterium]|nr:MAG: gluconokinase [Verrucomicrobiota bacterium]
MLPLILALDIGTSSSRASFFDETGSRLVSTTAQRTYPLITTPDGGAELDPFLLLDAIEQCIAQAIEVLRTTPALRGRPIAGVGVSCFWHSIVGTDSLGRPLTKIITWADARCRPEAAQLRETFSEEAVHARTGCMLRSSFWPAKLLWLRNHQKETFNAVKIWMSPAEWIQQTLTGRAVCALAMGTGTGMFDPTRLDWDPAMLSHCGLTPSNLLPLSDEPVAVGGALGEVFPELNGVPWFPAIGDGAASNLGSGCTLPGLAAINVGTSAALRIMRAGTEAKSPTGLFCYRVDAQRYLVGGAISNAGNLRAWCLRELQTGNPEELEAALAARPGPTHGLTVLPCWAAERAPTWNEDLQGSILGITHSTTGLDLFQAITEATYQRIAQIADLLVASTQETPKFLVSGGIQHSLTALQRLADILDQPLYANPEPEASIRGAAVYAMEKLGMPIQALPETAPLLPRKEIASRYREARAAQTNLEALLRGYGTQI